MVCAGTGVTTFKPHSTRTSTSKAFHLGIPLSGILKQGQSSFFNFYCRETEGDDGTEK